MLMRSSLMLTCCMLLLACAANRVNCDGPEHPYPDYAVYDAILTADFLRYGAKCVAVQKSTWPKTWVKPMPTSPEGRDAAENFRERNVASIELSNHFHVAANIILMNRSEFLSLLGSLENPWAPFQKKYPGCAGYVSFSAVGFNREHNAAIVFVESGAGFNYHAFLRCQNGHWVIVSKTPGDIASIFPPPNQLCHRTGPRGCFTNALCRGSVVPFVQFVIGCPVRCTRR
jgi:hypothetical protein